jgi:hypothetical protein
MKRYKTIPEYPERYGGTKKTKKRLRKKNLRPAAGHERDEELIPLYTSKTGEGGN